MTKGTLGAASSGRVDFGVAYTGLATVAYKLFAADGSLLQDWTTTGVTESPAGSGIYHVNWAANFYSTTLAATPQYGGIEWRTASSGGIYATDDLEISYAADASIAAIPASVWGAGTRTLTGFGTLVADIWAAVVDSAGITTLLSRLSAARATKLDNLDVAVSTRATPADVDVQVDADLVPVQASLDAIKAKTDLLGSNQVTVAAPITVDGKIQLFHGDDYSAADGRAIDWTSAGWPSLTGGTVKLALRSNGSGTLTEFTGSVVAASQARVALTAAQTGALEIDSYTYDLQATLASGRKVTLARGAAQVLKDNAT